MLHKHHYLSLLDDLLVDKIFHLKRPNSKTFNVQKITKTNGYFEAREDIYMNVFFEQAFAEMSSIVSSRDSLA